MGQYEAIQYIHRGEEIVIRSGQAADFIFDANTIEKRMKLYFRGETSLSYMWMGEPNMQRQYMQIEDAFDTEHACKCQYCLDFSQDSPVPWPKRIVKKSIWPPALAQFALYSYTDSWKVGIHVKAKELRIHENGYLRILIDRWDKVPGCVPAYTGRFPDNREVIQIPEGTYDWTRVEKKLRIPTEETACVMYTFEGMGYEGELYVEAPFLISSNGDNILPEFGSSVQTQSFFDWLGENLCKKEWPRFLISLNGRDIYDGELYARAHRYPEFAVDIPDELVREKNNRLSICLTTNCHDPLPFKLLDVAVVYTPGKRFSVVGNPEFLFEGEVLAVLVRTEEENVMVSLMGEGIQPINELFLAEKGLHVLRFEVDRSNYGKFNFTLSGCGEIYENTITYLPARMQDGVVTGSGDMIYIKNDDMAETEDYLSWYVANQVGKLITVRPAYLWGGSRYVNAKVWEMFQKTVNAMDMKYAHIVDGRDLPGNSANPYGYMLEGKGFFGRQLHERDGQLLYWPCPTSEYNPTIQEFFDLGQRKYLEHPENTEPLLDPSLMRMEDGRYCLLRDHDLPRDMEIAGKHVVEEMRAIRRDFLRHSGPSAAFKYFYQAGFEWTSAELMYGSFETTSSFLRGASKAYGVNYFGAHHAVQWSSCPHDTPERYRRYRLALYLSYMHGISEINTEEGFWHLEAYYAWFDRFSEACLSHLKQQKDFQRYVTLHTRLGKFYTPIAFVHGRYDGWAGFGDNEKVWGMPQMQAGDAEKGWELLKAVYPLNKPGKSLYMRGCPVEPVGYYSGTPFGCADVIPAETHNYEGYKLMTFAGYHKAEKEDVEALLKYVQSGGTLITGWAYLSETTDRDDVDAYLHSYVHFSGVVNKPEFVEDFFRGRKIHVATTVPRDVEVIEKTDSGCPLVYEQKIGKGRMLFVNAREYAGNEALLELWTQLIQSRLQYITNQENSWIYCGNDVEFTVYDQEDGSRVFYVLAVDWYNDPESIRTATLRVGDFKYTLNIKFGEMRKVVVSGDMAVWADNEDIELNSANGSGVEIKGVTDANLFIASNGKVKIEPVMERTFYDEGKLSYTYQPT